MLVPQSEISLHLRNSFSQVFRLLYGPFHDLFIQGHSRASDTATPRAFQGNSTFSSLQSCWCTYERAPCLPYFDMRAEY